MDEAPDQHEPEPKKIRRSKRVQEQITKRKLCRTIEQSESSEDDNYVSCDDCEQKFKGPKFCPKHGPLRIIPDSQDQLGLPREFVRLGPSGIPDAGIGAWTVAAVPSGVRFGPYKGILCDHPPKKSEYIWEIQNSSDKKLRFVDGEDRRSANWMRYVNCSRNAAEQNLKAFQYKKQIFYRTIVDIHADKELLVWYGEKYADQLQIDIDNYYHAPGPGTAADLPLEGSTPSTGHSKQTNYRNRKHSSSTSDSAFTQLVRLKDNRKINIGNKPYSCDICGKMFIRYHNLKFHKRTHTGKNLLSCNEFLTKIYSGELFKTSPKLSY